METIKLIGRIFSIILLLVMYGFCWIYRIKSDNGDEGSHKLWIVIHITLLFWAFFGVVVFYVWCWS